MEVREEDSKTRKKVDILLEDISSLERYISDLFTFAPLPICFVSPTGVVLEFNPAFSQLSGHDSYEIIGNGVDVIFSKKDLKRLIEETLSKEKMEGREFTLTTKNGGDVVVSVFTRLRKDREGNAVGIFIGAFDITEIKKKETELKEKVEELEKFQKILIGRELKMVEMKEEIRRLKEGGDDAPSKK